MANWADLDGLARHLKLAKSTLYKLVERGDLPGHKVGRTWRFDLDEVDYQIKAGQKKEPSSAKAADNDRNKQKKTAS